MENMEKKYYERSYKLALENTKSDGLSRCPRGCRLICHYLFFQGKKMFF